MAEAIYVALCAVLVGGLLLLWRRSRNWAAVSEEQGQQQTRAFAERHGLELLDPAATGVQGAVDGVRVSVDHGTLLVKALSGNVGRVRTVRVSVRTDAGQWLLCGRELAEQLQLPLPSLGQEHALGGGSGRRFVLRTRGAPPWFTGEASLLTELGQQRLRMGSGAQGRVVLHFELPDTYVGGLQASAEALGRLLMLGLAVAVPRRAEVYLKRSAAESG